MIDLDAMSKDPWTTWPVDKNELRCLVEENKRLRAGTGDGLRAHDWMNEAADEIERVRAELVVAERNVTFYYYKWKDETEKNAKLRNVLHHLSKLKDVQKCQNVSFEELTNYAQKITSAALDGEKAND